MIRRGVLGLLLAFAAAPLAAREQAVLISGARVFDGSGAPAMQAEVLIRDGTVIAVGRKLAAPAGTRRIRASGMTLLPGLIDLHTHLRSPAHDGAEDMPRAWAAYLLSGVTTVNDYSVSGEMIAPIRALTRQPGGIWAPQLNLAVRLGVPGGHGTEFGWGDGFTLQAATARAGRAAAGRALAYRPDVIKAFADGWRYGRDPDLASLNLSTLSAMVEAAHGAKVPVITHTVSLAQARIAARAGVDALGHGIGDAPVDEALAAEMRAHGTGYVSTLVVYEPQATRVFAPAEWQAMSLSARFQEDMRTQSPARPVPAYEAARWAILQDNIRRLKAAGVAIGVGTDAGIDGVYHGAATIREITLLTTLGLTPAEALAAATSVNAAIMHQADRGRIAPGLRADLLLVEGRPDEAIADLWRVRRVWVGGREAPLAALRSRIDSDAPTPLPAVRMTGPIDTGSRADGRTDLDTLPVEATDMGADHSHLEALRPAGPDRRFLVARLGAAPRPWAGLVWPLTRGGVLPADASGFTGIAFVARGAGAYRLSLDSLGIEGADRFAAGFEAGAEPREIRLPFSAFASRNAALSLDVARLRSLTVQLSGEPGGTAWLEIGQLRFY